MDYSGAFVNTLRSMLRRLGILALIKLPARARTRRRLAAYRKSRPERVEVAVGRQAATMLVADEVEYARVLSFHEDSAIIDFILGQLSPAATYWDVGASIGLYSVLAAGRVGPSGSVISFEPEARSFQRLLQNLDCNGLTNVRPFPLAPGRVRRKMSLIASEHASAGTHRLQSLPEETGAGLVEVLPGDELRTQEGLSVPNVIKVDVEGAEEDVLAGLEQTLRRRTATPSFARSILQSSRHRAAMALRRGSGVLEKSRVHTHRLARRLPPGGPQITVRLPGAARR